MDTPTKPHILNRVKTLKNLICCKRITVDTFYKKRCSNILKLVCKVDTSKSPRNHNNVPSESISDYFQNLEAIPLLDHLTVEIEKRFNHAPISVYSGLIVIIVIILLLSLVYKNVNWEEKANLFVDLLKDDFPRPKVLETELDLWEISWLESKFAFQTLYQAH